MRFLVAVLLCVAPVVVEAQTFGGWKWMKKEARTERVAAMMVNADSAAVAEAVVVDEAESNSRPKWAEAFGTSVASDRMSLTTSVVAIPLACGRCVFRVMGNEVKTQVEGATEELRDQRRQRVSDLQSLIDNGGSYAVHFARDGEFSSKSGRFRGFTQYHGGLGKLDAASDGSDDRYAANVALELVGKADIGRDLETLEVILGGRVSGVRALSGSLLSGLGEKTLGVYQVYGLVKVYGTTALTLSWTSVPGQQEYAPRFMIGFNVLKP